MPKYLVRVAVNYSIIVEADDEAAAIEKAPEVPHEYSEDPEDIWDTTSVSDYEAELYPVG